MDALRLRLMSGAAALLLLAPGAATAQQFQAPSPAEAAAALSQPEARFTRAQLDQMLAPIALYPDQVLMQVLMAATFPDQLLQAEDWLRDPGNAALRGDALYRALEPLPWDPSVKSLVAFPQLVAMLTDHLDWTEALGRAFANQQAETLARVQHLRRRALAAGGLRSTRQLHVERQGAEVVILPAEPDVVYLPVYNPAEVYGDWSDRDYPPVYLPPPPDFIAGPVGAGLAFSVGFGVIAPLWGWGHPDWRRHEVVVDARHYDRITHGTRDVAIRDHVWRRTGTVPAVPEARRPHPAETAARHPPGTVAPAAVARPQTRPAAPGTPAARPSERAVTAPAGAARPAERGAAHPPAAAPTGQRPSEQAVTHPPGQAVHRPPAAAPAARPAERAVRPARPEHPPEHAVRRAPEAAPAAPRPGERTVAHPPAARPTAPAASPPPRPAERAIAHPPAPPHPPEHAVTRPAARPAAPAARPAATPHPPAAHPAPAKPAAAQAAGQHPAGKAEPGKAGKEKPQQ